MAITRENHYVPEWYQRGFFIPGGRPQLFYQDLIPKRFALPNGQQKIIDWPKHLAPSQCFRQTDLYTTSILGFLNDEIERLLFGRIDSEGAIAVRAFAENDERQMHLSFSKFFEYMDAQKLRTPKGLAWLNANYRQLDHRKLLSEMQHIRQLNCTMWVEAVREIVSAKNSKTKFIVSDHPVTIYNRACPPNSTYCKFPDDPAISFLGSQTIFPLNSENCLILTNLEYAKDFERSDPLRQRTNPRNFSETLARTDAMIRTRSLTEEEVRCINFVLKSRAAKHIAAAEKEWLYPEKHVDRRWEEIAKVLQSPEKELWHFGGEIIVDYRAIRNSTPKSTSVLYQYRSRTTMPDAPDVRFREKFEEQLRFLARSSGLFDQGHEDESIRLATSLRVIFHDTRGSTSLMTHLGLKDVKMLSSSRGHGNWKDYLAHEINLSAPDPVRMRPLLGNQFVQLSLEDWWSNETVFVHANESFSRRLIILSAANKDGGAHVDRQLEAYYEVLCAGEYAIGINGDLQYEGHPPFPQGVTIFPKNAHLALIRQFAHETLSAVAHHDWLTN